MPRIVLTVALLAFTVYCLVDVVQTEGDQVRGIPKVLWFVVVALVPLIGGGAWLLAGRPTPLFGGGRDGGPKAGRPGPVGPDDDPDFLRGL